MKNPAKSTVSEIDLIALSAQAGDKGAVDRLGEELIRLIPAWIRKVLSRWGGPGKRRHLEEECLSLSGVLIMKALRTYRPGMPFVPYIRTVLIRGWVRRVVRPYKVALAEWGSPRMPVAAGSEGAESDGRDVPVALNLVPWEVGPEQRITTTESSAAVARILEKMDKSQADLLRMVYGIGVDGNGEPVTPKPVREMEREAGLNRNVLHQRLRVARQTFRVLAIEAGLN